MLDVGPESAIQKLSEELELEGKELLSPSAVMYVPNLLSVTFPSTQQEYEVFNQLRQGSYN